jgi:hypothetical protein
MNATKIIRWLIVILLLIIVALGLIIGVKIKPKTIIQRDTIRITTIDTIRIPKPVYITEKKIDTLTIQVKDTITINDTLYIQLPKTQRYYAKDSLYQAWVSGYKPSLDSINVFQKTIKETITNTITNKRRFGIGINAGYGIVFSNPVQLRPYLGVGVYYRLW